MTDDDWLIDPPIVVSRWGNVLFYAFGIVVLSIGIVSSVVGLGYAFWLNFNPAYLFGALVFGAYFGAYAVSFYKQLRQWLRQRSP